MSSYETWRAMRQFVSIGGETLAYQRLGTVGKPALILVHGWLGHGGIWRNLLAALEQEYDCIAVDLYGFGFSDKDDSADYSIPMQARRIFALAAALGLQTFSLIGHSMGGAIVLSLAAQYPEHVSKVINVSGVVTGKLTPYARRMLVPPVRLGYYFKPIWWMSRIGFRHSRWYKYLYVDHALTYEKDIIPLGCEDLLMSAIPGCETPTYHALNAINQTDLTAQLKTLRIPLLVIFGAADNMVPVSEGHYAHQHIPNAQLILYERCGHSPMMEAPERFVADVRAFLQG